MTQMMKQGHGQKNLILLIGVHKMHASEEPQLMSCNYYMYV